MKYQPPFQWPEASSPEAGLHNDNPSAPYVNANPSTATEGSYPPAESIEHPQREIVAAIVAAGITPSHLSLDQLAEAIARLTSKVITGVASGTANAHVLTAQSGVIVPKALFEGLVIAYLPSVTNTGAMTVNAFGLGVKAVVDFGDTALTGGELVAARPTAMRYDVTLGKFVLLPWATAKTSPTIISSVVNSILIPSRQLITSSGAFSITAPSNAVGGRVRAWGGGGGGGFGTNPSGAGGGGGGAYFEKTFTIAGGATVSGTVGNGGAAGVSGTNGATGGTTTLVINGTTYTVAGGIGGTNVTANAVGNSANGGTAPSGSDYPLGNGQPSSGGTQGYNGVGILYYAGKGGDAQFGGFGGLSGTGAGNAGQSPGGGGGGGANGNAAGIGAAGQAWFEWFLKP